VPPTFVSRAQRIYRARRIGTTFGRIYLGLRTQRFVANRLRPRDMDQRWHDFHAASAESIYQAAIELRGLILKGCQFIGSRADVLPKEYVEALSRLQDRVPARPFAVVKECVESELGRPIEDVFDDFSTDPIASASLAQVHDARLPDGTRVAVKVQYPEIAALVKSDLANLRFLFKAVGLLEREVDLLPLVDELGTHVPRELNFVNEGHNAEAIARQFADRDDIAVPRIHWELTTRKVLVMDFVEGVKITDVDALREWEIDPKQVAQLLVDSYCTQILRHGFFHADPHPGNLIVQRMANGAPRLVLVDFGLAKELPSGFRKGVVAFAGALLQGRSDAMADALVDLGFETRDGHTESMEEIARFLLDTGIEFQKRSHLSRDMTDRVGRELPEKIRANPIVTIPSHVVLIGRVMGLLSGVSRSLDSKVDLMGTLLPYALEAPPTSRAPSPGSASAPSAALNRPSPTPGA
jgi:predicted unusual protein kinase regulating ubiquinone biosynthesis (AarF/ABC1/UbiB family)